MRQALFQRPLRVLPTPLASPLHRLLRFPGHTPRGDNGREAAVSLGFRVACGGSPRGRQTFRASGRVRTERIRQLSCPGTCGPQTKTGAPQPHSAGCLSASRSSGRCRPRSPRSRQRRLLMPLSARRAFRGTAGAGCATTPWARGWQAASIPRRRSIGPATAR
jgi:hypothetical protein